MDWAFFLSMKSIYSPAYRALLAWLRTSRKGKGLTMRDVGVRMGVPHTWVGKVETGERRLDVAEYVQLCRALGVACAPGIALVEKVLDAGRSPGRKSKD
jgi:transcriptional regulator with XRE-family HTH domain